jgi:hypothetical protein
VAAQLAASQEGLSPMSEWEVEEICLMRSVIIIIINEMLLGRSIKRGFD